MARYSETEYWSRSIDNVSIFTRDLNTQDIEGERLQTRFPEASRVKCSVGYEAVQFRGRSLFRSRDSSPPRLNCSLHTPGFHSFPRFVSDGDIAFVVALLYAIVVSITRFFRFFTPLCCLPYCTFPSLPAISDLKHILDRLPGVSWHYIIAT